MKKTLGSIIFFGITLFPLACIVLPFLDIRFILLIIPFTIVMPHIPYIALWCFGTMEGDSNKYLNGKE